MRMVTFLGSDFADAVNDFLAANASKCVPPHHVPHPIPAHHTNVFWADTFLF
jgi:hypothetical protein